MKGIFLSYRREDTAGHAGRLFDRLAAHFGKDSIFMDVEGIGPGTRFAKEIENAVGRSDVFLAVIGRGWVDCKDEQGARRLDNPNDFIRLETRSALSRNVRVIPVLVEGAHLPRQEELPEDLQELTERQAIELRDTHWNNDIQALIAKLEPGAEPPLPPGRSTRASFFVSALIALAALGLSFFINPLDAWFIGYLVAGAVTVAALWLVLDNMKGVDQRRGVLTAAAAFVLVAIMVVAWGYSADAIKRAETNYSPYAVLALAWVIASFSSIFSRAERGNRGFVFTVWVGLGLCFLAARLVWEILTPG